MTYANLVEEYVTAEVNDGILKPEPAARPPRRLLKFFGKDTMLPFVGFFAEQLDDHPDGGSVTWSINPDFGVNAYGADGRICGRHVVMEGAICRLGIPRPIRASEFQEAYPGFDGIADLVGAVLGGFAGRAGVDVTVDVDPDRIEEQVVVTW